MRYERKYRIEAREYQQVLNDIMLLSGAFSEAYPDRWVNSFYLDSINYGALHDNLSGISNRNKFRLRWYGDTLTNINTPILEEKVKANLLGYKNLKQLPSFTFSPIELRHQLNIEPIQSLGLEPILLVRYLRTYLESYDRRVRITIDRDLHFHGINNYSPQPFKIEDKAIILEVKYDQDIESEIDDILQGLQYRLTKNSKFVSGMMGFYA